MFFNRKKTNQNVQNQQNDDRINVDTSTITTMVGVDTIIEGTLRTKSSIRINGTVKGDVRAKGIVVLTKTGCIEGTIEAESIIVAGVVRGNMSIRDKVNVEASGQIYGEVITKKFVIDEESIFQGNCVMNRDGRIIPVPPYISEADRLKAEAAKKAAEEKAAKNKKEDKNADKKDSDKKDSDKDSARKNESEDKTSVTDSDKKDSDKKEADSSSQDKEKDSADIDNSKNSEKSEKSESSEESDAKSNSDDESEGTEEAEESEDSDGEIKENSESDSEVIISAIITSESDSEVIIADINEVEAAEDIPASDGVGSNHHHSGKDRNRHNRKNFVKKSKSLSVEIQDE